MNKDMERFLDECHADPHFQEHLDHLDVIENLFEDMYHDGDESADQQKHWDQIRAIATEFSRPLRERWDELIALMEFDLTRPSVRVFRPPPLA